MTNSVYNKAKWATMILLPALSTLYFALGGIWGLPYVTEVVGTVAALTTFMGVLLGLSSRAYNASDARFDGDAIVTHHDGVKTFTLAIGTDPDDLDKQDELRFKVIPTSQEKQGL